MQIKRIMPWVPVTTRKRRVQVITGFLHMVSAAAVSPAFTRTRVIGLSTSCGLASDDNFEFCRIIAYYRKRGAGFAQWLRRAARRNIGGLSRCFEVGGRAANTRRPMTHLDRAENKIWAARGAFWNCRLYQGWRSKGAGPCEQLEFRRAT
jgi:hypothetical protein